MCGIGGYKGKCETGVLEVINNAQHHRGPDDSGVFFEKDIGLAHRRLSIIDLSPAGHQPLTNEDGSVWIVFNGEIYNFKELKQGLKQQHIFKGQSDTEIIVHLYEEVGEKVFEMLSGMFAIALYDRKADKLLLARDRMGKKPLYYWHKKDAIVFSSELKALATLPDFNKTLDREAINQYFLYDYIPAPRTPFTAVKKVPAGHYFVIEGTTSKLHRFWGISFVKKTYSEKEALIELDRLLAGSVGRRLVADVPLGIFLSGGIDSSTVAYYAQKASKTKIKTFSIAFGEETFDESSYAQEVADVLGTEHSVRRFSSDAALALVPRLAELVDEPMADPSILPTFLLSQFAREEVTVALGGDGGDELFAGYDTFVAEKLMRLYAYIPAGMRKIISKIVALLPVKASNMSLEFRLKRFVQGAFVDEDIRNETFMSAWSDSDRQKLWHPNLRSEIASYDPYQPARSAYQSGDAQNWVDKLSQKFIKTYMQDDILVKVDRASMAASLEVRAPFLDNEVVAFATSLTPSLKLHGFTTKYLLKKLMDKRLPKNAVWRKKKGFGIPIAAWLRGPLLPELERTLSSESLAPIGLFDTETVQMMIREHREGTYNRRKELWSLFVFVLWYKRYAAK